jgi:Ca-activated chloride channel homolog
MFAEPAWLWLLLLLPPLLVASLWLRRRSRRQRSGLVAPRLAPRLVLSGKPGFDALGLVSLHLALALIVLAQARPQWGETVTTLPQTGRNLLIAIDTSKSMLAADIPPSRLARAKLVAKDVIAALPGERIGVVAFAGTAFLQAPLTLDHTALVETIHQLDSRTIPLGGTNMSAALKLALATFEEAPGNSHALLLLTDGGETEGEASQLASQLAEAGVIVVATGIGTRAGAIVPDGEGSSQFVTDASSQPVRSALEEPILIQLAEASGGIRLVLDRNTDVPALVRTTLDRIDASAGEERIRREPIERYHWPLALGLLLLLFALVAETIARLPCPIPSPSPLPTPSAAAASPALSLSLLLLVATTPLSSSTAQEPSSAGLTSLLNRLLPFSKPAAPDPNQLLQSGELEQAQRSFAEQAAAAASPAAQSRARYGEGTAAYQRGEFRSAERAFSEALRSKHPADQANAHHALANSLFRNGETILEKLQEEAQAERSRRPPPAGESTPADPLKPVITRWEDALSHYESTLEIDPENKAALQNLEHVKARLEQLQQEQEEEQGEGEPEQGEPQEGEGEGEPQQGEPQEGEEGQDPDQEQESEGDPQHSDEQRPDLGGAEQPQEQSLDPGAPDGEDTSGELSAMDGEPAPDLPPTSPEQQVDPETGFNPEDARNLLRAYADEDPDAIRQDRRPYQSRPSRDY